MVSHRTNRVVVAAAVVVDAVRVATENLARAKMAVLEGDGRNVRPMNEAVPNEAVLKIVRRKIARRKIARRKIARRESVRE